MTQQPCRQPASTRRHSRRCQNAHWRLRLSGQGDYQVGLGSSVWTRATAYVHSAVGRTGRGVRAQGASQTAYIGESGAGDPPVLGIDGLLELVAGVRRLREVQAETDVGGGGPPEPLCGRVQLAVAGGVGGRCAEVGGSDGAPRCRARVTHVPDVPRTGCLWGAFGWRRSNNLTLEMERARQ